METKEYQIGQLVFLNGVEHVVTDCAKHRYAWFYKLKEETPWYNGKCLSLQKESKVSLRAVKTPDIYLH